MGTVPDLVKRGFVGCRFELYSQDDQACFTTAEQLVTGLLRANQVEAALWWTGGFCVRHDPTEILEISHKESSNLAFFIAGLDFNRHGYLLIKFNKNECIIFDETVE